MVRLLLLGGIVMLFSSAMTQGAKKGPGEILISAEAAVALVESDYKMNPEKALKPGKLRAYLAHRKRGSGEITAAELQALRKGQPESRPRSPAPLPPQTGAAPPGTFSVEQVRLRFQAKEQLNLAEGKDKPTARDYEDRLRSQVAPGATWFKSDQIINAEKYEWLNPPSEEHKKESEEETTAYKALDSAYEQVLALDEALHQGMRSPRIRRSWRDVLYDEDQTQTGKALGDLEGALVSYNRDRLVDADTWNVKGAIILPITYRIATDAEHPADFSLRQWALAPSITVDRVDTNADPKNETDSLLYRIAAYFDFYGTRSDDQRPYELGYGLQMRAAGVYATDTGHNAGLTAFEGDFEPRFHYGNVALGYKVNLWEKSPERADWKDNTFLEGQLRLWLHTEAGRVQDTAAGWLEVDDSFFRLGPTIQLSFTAPVLPGYRNISLTALYSYLAALSGPDDRASYFRMTLGVDLLRNIELNHRVGLAASYERGGLNFTKPQVDTFTLGLNVLF